MKNPKIRNSATAHVDVPTDTFAHLNDVLDCISWRQDRQSWQCAKDDLLVELEQFKLRGATINQKAVFQWLRELVALIPGTVEYVTFRQHKGRPGSLAPPAANNRILRTTAARKR